MAWTATLVAAGACAVVLAACNPGIFHCADASACSDGERAAWCEPTGFCSFPDASCTSGRRYGVHGPDDLARECVTPVGDAPATTAPGSGEPADPSTGGDDGADPFGDPESSGDTTAAPPGLGPAPEPSSSGGDGSASAGTTGEDSGALDGGASSGEGGATTDDGGTTDPAPPPPGQALEPCTEAGCAAGLACVALSGFAGICVLPCGSNADCDAAGLGDATCVSAQWNDPEFCWLSCSFDDCPAGMACDEAADHEVCSWPN